MAKLKESVVTAHEALVTVSFGYTCGCTQRPSEPIKAIEANVYPGGVIICDKHNEFAVIDRVTTRLVPDDAVIRALLVASGMIDQDVVHSVPIHHGRD